MNKLLTTSLLAGSCLLLATAAQAQLTVSIGPKVGETLAKMRVDGDGHTDYRYGFAGGTQAYLGWGRFALQPALLFAQKGYKFSEQVLYSSTVGGSYVPVDLLTRVRLNYLTLPLNFTFAPEGTATGPQFFAGPYVSLLLGGSYEQELSGIQSTSEPVHVTDNLEPISSYSARRVDAGFQAGLGFRADHLVLQIDYSIGLRYTVPAYYYLAVPVRQSNLYNNSFLFAANYLFDLKH